MSIIRRPDIRRIGEGAFLVVVGVLMLALIPTQVGLAPSIQAQTSPRFIPRVVGLGIIIVGAAMVVLAFVSKTRDAALSFTSDGVVRAVLSMLLLIAYAVLFPMIGFVVTSGLFLGAFSYLFGGRDVRKIAAAMVVAPVIIWLVFEKLFNIPLPHGFLF